jgi:hypothetical protein
MAGGREWDVRVIAGHARSAILVFTVHNIYALLRRWMSARPYAATRKETL